MAKPQQSPENRKPRTGNWLTKGAATLAAVGAFALGACGVSTSAEKGPEPAPVTSSAPATPGEATPSATASETEATEGNYELQGVEASEIYQKLSDSDKKLVEQAVGTDLENYADLDPAQRTLTAFVLADANKGVSEYTVPGDAGEVESATWAIEEITNDIQAASAKEVLDAEDGQAVFTVIDELNVLASRLAFVTGDSTVAKKIVLGTFDSVDKKPGVRNDTIAVVEDLTERLDEAAAGDSSVIYNGAASNDVSKRLPTNSSDVKFTKFKEGTMYGLTNRLTSDFYGIPEGSGVSYIAETRPTKLGDGEITRWRISSQVTNPTEAAELNYGWPEK